MKDYEKKGWKRYGTGSSSAGRFVYKHSECFYQKEIVDDIYAEIVQYSNPEILSGTEFELHLQIHNIFSIVGETINVTVFSYRELDFEKMEKDARLIVKRLTKAVRKRFTR